MGARPDGTGMRCAGCSDELPAGECGVAVGFGPRRRGPRRHGRAAARADACGDGELEAVGACAVVILGLAVECVVGAVASACTAAAGLARPGCVGGRADGVAVGVGCRRSAGSVRIGRGTGSGAARWLAARVGRCGDGRIGAPLLRTGIPVVRDAEGVAQPVLHGV